LPVQSGTCRVVREVTVAEGRFTPGHLGELTQIVPFEMVDAVLAETGAVQHRVRDLPSRVVVYLLLAGALFTECGYRQVWARMITGLDGLAVVTSSQNQFVTQLNFDQLAEIWKQGGAKTWNQVDSKFPNEQLAIFAPDTESGTYDFFTEEILGDPDEGAPKPRSDYTASSDDNTLVQGIEGEANSWGYFGFAYYQNNKEGLKDIKVAEKASGPYIQPSAETIESGDYPLSRPLFIYVKEDSLKKPEVGQFVKFYLEQTPQLITDVGYVPAPQDDYTQGLAKLQPFLTS